MTHVAGKSVSAGSLESALMTMYISGSHDSECGRTYMDALCVELGVKSAVGDAAAHAALIAACKKLPRGAYDTMLSPHLGDYAPTPAAEAPPPNSPSKKTRRRPPKPQPAQQQPACDSQPAAAAALACAASNATDVGNNMYYIDNPAAVFTFTGVTPTWPRWMWTHSAAPPDGKPTDTCLDEGLWHQMLRLSTAHWIVVVSWHQNTKPGDWMLRVKMNTLARVAVQPITEDMYDSASAPDPTAGNYERSGLAADFFCLANGQHIVVYSSKE